MDMFMSKELITVISAWRNEELMAPFFLRHYFDIGAYEVHIILDDTTSDNTLKIIENDIRENGHNIVIHHINYPNGFCDHIKINKVNDIYKSISSGWVICCDADELVFTKEYLESDKPVGETLYEFAQRDIVVVNSNMTHPFRNVNDSDLDINKDTKVILQRRHGSKVPPTTDDIPITDVAYKKPMVLRANQQFTWSVGHHVLFDIYGRNVFVPDEIMGVHWKYADPSFITYSTNNHLSNFQYIQNNLSRGMGHHWVETLEASMKKCEEHKNDSELF